jgi:hypothetical protein
LFIGQLRGCPSPRVGVFVGSGDGDVVAVATVM